MSDHPAPLPKPLWALLIGNASYKAIRDENGDSVNLDLKGPEEDVDNLYEFLVDELQVPAKNIICLKNGTRDKMLGSFRSHLIDNPLIKHDDPLLFYYSGHGGRTVSPEGWPTLLDSKGDRKTEQLIPSDCSKGGDGHEAVEAIPDRTINALLAEAADKHGDNITVILDCCFAAHATRKDPYIRLIPEDLLPPLSVDTDVDIWHKVELSWSRIRKSASNDLTRVLGDPACRSHVLLAACRVNEFARTHSDPRSPGGYFTFALLHALDAWRESGMSWTYSELIRHVQENMRKKLEGVQTPGASGWLLERPLFQPFVDRRRFVVEPVQGEPRKARILAGYLHAIVHDTVFALFDSIDSSGRITHTSPYEVTATTSLILLPEGVVMKARPTQTRSSISHASIVCPGTTHRLKVHIPAETVALHRDAFELLKPYSVDMTDDPDLIIEANTERPGSFKLTRNDPILSQDELIRVVLTETRPNFNFVSIDTITYRLSVISMFNFHLSHAPASPPFYPNVVAHFGIFHESARARPNEPQIAREYVEGRIIPSTGDTEVLLRSDESYALVIKNETPLDLFFYAVYFDPLKYRITPWYQPQGEQAFVRPHDTLQLGRSSEKKQLLRFTLNPGQDKDIGFMKVYALPKYVDMRSLSQQGFYSGKTSRGDGTQSLRDDVVGDQWDMIRFKIVCTR